MSEGSQGESGTLVRRGRRTLRQLQQEGRHCDTELITDDGCRLQAHAVVLAAAVPYFRALFTARQRQNQQRGHTHVPGVSGETMRHVVEHVYTGGTSVSRDNVSALLHAADYLSYDHMLETVCRFIIEHLSPANCLGVRRLASFYSAHTLSGAVNDYICRNFVDIVGTITDTQSGSGEEGEEESVAELLQLPVDELVQLLGEDDLNVKSEETVWRTIVAWIAYDRDARVQYMPTLLQRLRRGLLDRQFFERHVQTHPLVVSSEECGRLLQETQRFFRAIDSATSSAEEPAAGELSSTPQLAQPRFPHEILFAIGGWSGHSPTGCIETYDTRADRWVPVPEQDPQGPRAYHGTAVLGTSIYVIGGFDGMHRFNSCRRFDTRHRTWSELAPMHEQRCYVSVVALHGYIYALGGSDGYSRHRSVERYDPLSNQWSLVASMSVQRSDASATTLDGRIFICGGFNGQDCLNSAEVYDPVSDQWSPLASMRSRRSGVSAVTFRQTVYVLGGFNGILRLNTVERYSETGGWTHVADMYTPRSNFAVAVIDDMIFAIGGYNGSTTTVQVECYDADRDEWYEATDMGLNRSALSACVLQHLPNRMDYMHKHRDRLLEEKRQRYLDSTTTDGNSNDTR